MLDPAVELAVERGAAAVTHRAVAERAGLLVSTEHRAAVAPFEVCLLSSRDPDPPAAVADALESYRRVTVTLLRALGVRRAQATARAFNALPDGFVLHRVANPRLDDADELRPAFIALYIAYAIDGDEPG